MTTIAELGDTLSLLDGGLLAVQEKTSENILLSRARQADAIEEAQARHAAELEQVNHRHKAELAAIVDEYKWIDGVLSDQVAEMQALRGEYPEAAPMALAAE